MRAKCWAVVPAAGSGTRMGTELPKQYLPLAGRRVIEHTLERLGNHPRISGIVVALADGDLHWSRVKLACPAPVLTVTGGRERCHSVLNGLSRLREIAQPDDWVLVHDAARPCLRASDIDRLIAGLADHPVGGLLAVPVFDTLKRADGRGEVLETVERAGLWRALTPQMFRLEPLFQAIAAAVERGVLATDEAAAMELSGARPRLVEGHADNIKITCPQDLAMAEFYLRRLT